MSNVLMCPMTASDALVRLDEVLDLSRIRSKLSDPEEGKGYGEARLDLMEAEYRKFLAMHLRSLSSRLRHLVVEFSEQPPRLWAC